MNMFRIHPKEFVDLFEGGEGAGPCRATQQGLDMP